MGRYSEVDIWVFFLSLSQCALDLNHKIEELIKAQINLLAELKELLAKWENLTDEPLDKFMAEQFLERIEDYFNQFQENHKELVAIPEMKKKRSYLKHEIPMATEDAYYYKKTFFNRVLSTFQYWKL